MTVVDLSNLTTRALQVMNETAGFANSETRIGSLFRDMVDSLSSSLGVLNVRSYGALPSNSGIQNDTAIALAITAATAAGAQLYWPAGNYTSAASIVNLHTVRHRGPGFIKRGTDFFAVENVQASNNTNRLYVATAGGGGSASNDGLSSSQPMLTPQQAFTALKNYGPVLDGTWKVIIAAGTYAVHSQTYDVSSKDWVTIQGPSVGGHPNVPTAIFDGSGFAANQHGFVVGTGGGGTAVKAWFQDIKCQDYNAGAQNSCGWSQGYGARCIYVNCHADNCDFAGILADQGDICLVSGGIINACRDGVVLNATKGTVGYGGPFTLGGSTRITACTEFGLFWSRGAQGHCDNVFFDQNAIALRIESSSRVHLLGSDFRRSTTSAIATNTDGSYYDDVSEPNAYNDGTGNANAKRYFHGAFSGAQQNWTDVATAEMCIYAENLGTTLTSAVKAQVGADLVLPLALGSTGGIRPYYFVDKKTRIRIKVWGDLPNATASFGVNFVNGGTTTVMAYPAFVGTPAAGGFEFELIIAPLTQTTQRGYARAEGSTIVPRLESGATTADMGLEQTVKLMAQSASGTITVRRCEIWVSG